MRFWVLFDEKTSLSSFTDEQHSFTRNWAQNEDLMLGGQFLMWNLRKLCFLSNLWSFGCFHSKRCVSVKKLHLFHINPPFSVSWGKMRFWVLFDEKTSLSSFTDERHSFTRNWAQNEDLMLGGQFLCDIWGNYVSYHIYVFFGCSHCKRGDSGKKLHLFQINPPLSVSWGEMRFWVVLEEKDNLIRFCDEQ